MEKFDITIIGAGVVGLAIAHAFTNSKRLRAARVALIEKESSFGQHTSSRHSEVIHAGIYYPPGSLKACLCTRGKEMLYEFCDSYEITYKRLGKLIISKEKNDQTLADLKRRAEANGVSDLQWWDHNRLQQQEPAVRAHSALHSPSTGIIDSHGYMERLLQLAQEKGLIYATHTEIMALERTPDGIQVTSRDTQSSEEYRFLSEICINAAGLGAQELARESSGFSEGEIPRLYPCKGEYFAYNAPNPFNHLIYPKPEANTRGLGIHSTVDLAGRLRFGPDANYIDRIDYSTSEEKRSAFASSIEEYFPALDESKLMPAYAGIRPKLAGPGMPAADFEIKGPSDHGEDGLFHLFGVESPGFTSSLALAEYILDMV